MSMDIGEQMREIKFRAWDNDKKVFVVGMICFGYDDFEWVVLNDNYEQILWSYNGTLIQYTGLKDKNGKEIYEGDIVKQSKFSGYFSITGEYETEEVIYENGCFCIKIMKDVLSSFRIMSDNCEVIGNIYENPELLENR